MQVTLFLLFFISLCFIHLINYFHVCVHELESMHSIYIQFNLGGGHKTTFKCWFSFSILFFQDSIGKHFSPVDGFDVMIFFMYS